MVNKTQSQLYQIANIKRKEWLGNVRKEVNQIIDYAEPLLDYLSGRSVNVEWGWDGNDMIYLEVHSPTFFVRIDECEVEMVISKKRKAYNTVKDLMESPEFKEVVG